MQSLKKLGSLISLPMAALLVVFFFFPWLSLQCGPGRLTASGWQLTTGTASVDTGMLESGMEKQKTNEEIAKLNEVIQARPWFIAGLLAPAALLIVGALAVKGVIKPGSAGYLLIILALGGATVTLGANRVSYADDVIDAQKQAANMGPDAPDPAAALSKEFMNEVRKMVAPRGTPWLWISISMYAFVAVCGIINLVMVKNLAKLHSEWMAMHRHELTSSQPSVSVAPPPVPTFVPPQE